MGGTDSSYCFRNQFLAKPRGTFYCPHTHRFRDWHTTQASGPHHIGILEKITLEMKKEELRPWVGQPVLPELMSYKKWHCQTTELASVQNLLVPFQFREQSIQYLDVKRFLSLGPESHLLP